MSSPISTAVFGATGLVGGHIVSTLLSLDAFGAVHTITRRAPRQAADAAASAKLDAVVEPDTAKWADALKTVAASAGSAKPVVFSGLGTTRAAAGGVAAQWKIDHDLNIEIARAAKVAGATTFVFISSGGTQSLVARQFPYAKMKNGVEAAIKELGFEQAIVVRPGMILGEREVARGAESLFQTIVRGLGSVSTGVQDTIGQDAEVIARAAVHAALLAQQGKAPSKHWELSASDIVRLGRDEWKF